MNTLVVVQRHVVLGPCDIRFWIALHGAAHDNGGAWGVAVLRLQSQHGMNINYKSRKEVVSFLLPEHT